MALLINAGFAKDLWVARIANEQTVVMWRRWFSVVREPRKFAMRADLCSIKWQNKSQWFGAYYAVGQQPLFKNF